MNDNETLKYFRDDLPYLINFTLKEELDKNDDPEEIPILCEEISLNYRLLAICRLLVDADTDGYYDCLIKSAMTKIYFLECSKKYSKTDIAEMASSRNGPFLDTIAAGQFSLGCKMADLTTKTWMEEDEYEDDFCYSHFLYYFVNNIKNINKEYLLTLTKQFENFLEEDDNSRLKICYALLDKDQNNFDKAFDDLIDDRAAEMETEDKSLFGTEMDFHVQQYVFIEGLALLRIAEKIGFKTHKEYKYCPSIARLPMKKSFPLDGYPKLSS